MFGNSNSTRKRLQELETKFLHLENEYKALRLDWENAYDKLLHMMQRVSKRAADLQREMDGGRKPLSSEEEALLAPTNDYPARPVLSPAQIRAQSAVELRRRTKPTNGEA